MTQWHVYLVRCRDRALYTGIATDVARRFAEHQHNKGRGARYLRGRGPLQLVFKKAIGTRSLALRIESQIKKLAKAGKEKLLKQSDMIEQMVVQAKKRSSQRVHSP